MADEGTKGRRRRRRRSERPEARQDPAGKEVQQSREIPAPRERPEGPPKRTPKPDPPETGGAPVTVTVDSVAFTIRRLDNGNIRVTHAGTQSHPMRGPDTEGVVLFEVHPCQTRWFAYWNGLLAPAEQIPTGPGRGGATPWWSSKSWKEKSRRVE